MSTPSPERPAATASRVTACCSDGLHDLCSTRIVTNPEDGWHRAKYAPCECECHEAPAATTLRCDGSCGYTTTEGKFGDRCPNCDYGVLVEDEDADA